MDNMKALHSLPTQIKRGHLVTFRWIQLAVINSCAEINNSCALFAQEYCSYCINKARLLMGNKLSTIIESAAGIIRCNFSLTENSMEIRPLTFCEKDFEKDNSIFLRSYFCYLKFSNLSRLDLATQLKMHIVQNRCSVTF